MVQPVMVRAEQHQVVQLGRPAVFPMHEVMGVQTPGGPTAGHHARAVAVLQGAAQPAADHPGRPPGPDRLPGAFKPHLTGGVTGQIAPISIGQQRTQMQVSHPVLDIHVHHHRGVLPVRAAGGLGVPAGIDQPHKRRPGARSRRPLPGLVGAVVVIEFPLHRQRITMRGQGRVELRRLQMRQGDPVMGVLLIGGLGDRDLRLGIGPRIRLRLGLGSGSGRGSSLTAVRNWDTEATRANSA